MMAAAMGIVHSLDKVLVAVRQAHSTEKSYKKCEKLGRVKKSL